MHAILDVLMAFSILGAIWELTVISFGWYGDDWKIDLSIAVVLMVVATILGYYR